MVEKRNVKYDFLKNWRIVRYWAKRKYNITQEEIDILLFFYSEGIFKRKDFYEHQIIFKWDKGRFNRLVRDGYISNWRDYTSKGAKSKLYELSIKSKRICLSIYKKLMYEETISENRQHNPIFGKASYSDKMYRQVIKRMNQKAPLRG